MTGAEWQMLIKGKGCPACDGKPVYDCTKFGEEHIFYDQLKEACENLEWGRTCSKDGECEFRKRRPRVDAVEFLTSLDANTDGMEALDAAMDIEFEERRRR